MPKRKGVKGTREKGDLPAFFEGDAVIILQIVRDKAVNVVERGCVVIPQHLILVPQNEGQDLTGHRGKVLLLLRKGEAV